MPKFNGIEIIALEKPTQNFGGVSVTGLSEFPKEIQDLEDGYYSIDGHEFHVSKGKYRHEVATPLWSNSIIEKWLHDKWQKEHEEEEKKKQDEMKIWTDDLEKPLMNRDKGHTIFLKNWKGRTVKLIESNEYEEKGDNKTYDVFINDKQHCELEYITTDGEPFYRCWDWESYYRKDANPKIALQNMLEKDFRWKDEQADYEPSCSACGDGGCIHCEPYRFI